MKILFFGDSITDMGRSREYTKSSDIWSYGSGYPIFIASDLYRKNPKKYEIINRGIGGNRIADLYARIKTDVWDLKPDVVSILIGINEIWCELESQNGWDIERFEKTYKCIIEETKKHLPNVKIVLCEPFVLKGSATENTESLPDKYKRFLTIYDFAKVVKNLAKEYDLYFLPLQEKFNEQSKKYGVECYLYDGVHPMIAGATLIADEWLRLFQEKIEEVK